MVTTLLVLLTVVVAVVVAFTVAGQPQLCRESLARVTARLGSLSVEVQHRAREVGRRAREVGRRAREVGRRAREVGHRAREVGRRAREVGRRAREVGRRPLLLGRGETPRLEEPSTPFRDRLSRSDDFEAPPPTARPANPTEALRLEAAPPVPDRSLAVAEDTPPEAELAEGAAAPVSPFAEVGLPPSVRFDPVAPRGTQSVLVDHHTPEWKAEMAAAGERFAAAGVCAIVFVHGTFTGSDPLSAYGVVERALPSSIGPYVARTLRKKTRGYIERVLGDLGNFGTAYVRLFEEAIRPRGSRIPCTDFVWSSENHHVGRLEGALGLVRVLATHAELGGEGARRILVIGHSHAGQLFALATQLLARSIATEAILDIARAREIDVAALETDIATLVGPRDRADRRGGRVNVDFVTFGAPNRYAWATVPSVRALHVIAVPPSGARGAIDGDWIRRLGVEGSDFPALGGEDRRINALLADSLGHAGFAPTRVASALRAGVGLPSNGEVAFVEYGDKGLLGTGLTHGAYTRLDAMLFHAKLLAERLYPQSSAAPASVPSASSSPSASPSPASAPASRAWSAIRALGPTPKSRPMS